MRGSLVLLVVVGGFACSEVTTSSKVAPGASLEGYHTFAWATGEPAHSAADQEVRAVLQRELALRGMIPAPANDGGPDFLVGYHAQQQNKVESVPRAGTRFWGKPDEIGYTEGTLVVEFADARTGNVFWRGTATSPLDAPGPDRGKIDKAVSQLMQKYPAPAQAAAARPSM